ncbi:helicase-associated domain-containing protein [Paenibacillus sp. P32E]|uniref:helicase-associated domain-containing protein n=1 Tax=Paenibacillus sp. P32E TaxID=1349434 RepID=UPI00093EA0C9|nr:helicase-associated domain-containing protein [Paenibacillus sp. P32E]OKP82584.1 hypothetical protein A3848_28590 [Paenibacillus sp. P32E]
MMGLSREALLVLHQIIKNYAAQRFTEAQAEQLSPVSLCRVELHLALLELREAGVLELRQKLWGERLYQIPGQYLPFFLQKLFPGSPVRAAGRVAVIEAEAGPELAGQWFRTLVFIASEGLPVTAKGAVHKKNISRLADTLTLPEEQLKGLFPPDQLALYPFPLPVMVMLDLLLCLGLVRRTDSAYLLDTGMLENWLQLSGIQMSNLLYGVILNRYGLPGPAEQHFRYIISSSGYYSGQWFMIRDILAWMSEMGLALGQSMETLEASARNWLRALAGFGWCELGSLDDGSACFRWTAARPEIHPGEPASFSSPSSGIPAQEIGAEKKRDQETLVQQAGKRPVSASPGFIVQPDFEVLVPPECPYSQRWMLAACAELLHSDDLWSYRLTRNKLESAAEQGLSPQNVISWLAKHAKGGLPDQVEQSLVQWGKGIGRTELSEVILLSCRSEADGNDIAAHPRVAGILSRLGPLHFIVRAEDIELVRKELGAAGMAPAKRIAGQEEKPGKDWPLVSGSRENLSSAAVFSVDGTERGLLVSAPELPRVPFNPHAAEEAILTGLESVPQMWMKQWRKYHVTTAQKVMEQALEWGIKVRLTHKGQDCEFIPVRISRNPWEVKGVLLSVDSDSVEEMRLGADDWQEMQLIIPKLRRNSSSA